MLAVASSSVLDAAPGSSVEMSPGFICTTQNPLQLLSKIDRHLATCLTPRIYQGCCERPQLPAAVVLRIHALDVHGMEHSAIGSLPRHAEDTTGI